MTATHPPGHASMTDAETVEGLLPCPFCDGEANHDTSELYEFACCKNDGCHIQPSTGWCKTDPPRAIAAWNARAPAQTGVVEALREALEPFANADIDVSGTAAIGVTADDIDRAHDVFHGTTALASAKSPGEAIERAHNGGYTLAEEGGSAIPASMTPWHGGDAAPADWDGGRVLLRSGLRSCPNETLCWRHPHMNVGGVTSLGGDIIAYTRTPTPAQGGEAIPMILHCPRCHVQHIDEPDERTPEWDNPPHRSHLCHACGCIWRPADVPTEGVASIATRGRADTPLTAAPTPELSVREAALAGIRSILSLLGNVDHSRGGGENAARIYGSMLESIREIAIAAAPTPESVAPDQEFQRSRSSDNPSPAAGLVGTTIPSSTPRSSGNASQVPA